MDDLKAHFKMGYAPNNCIMVVSGDVTAAEIVALAKKYIEPIPSQPPPPPIRTKEPEQLGERRVTVRRPAQLSTVMIAYHIPETKHADNTALELLDTILSTGRSSRLYQRLVEKDQLVLNVGGGAQQALDPTLFMFNMQVRSGKSSVDAEKALYEELERVAREGVTTEELDKARNQQLAGFYRSLKTIAGKANLLGNFELFRGDWNQINSFAAEIDKVKPADIQRVAAKYFTEKNRTVATLIPESQKEATK
jgi:zinc protease